MSKKENHNKTNTHKMIGALKIAKISKSEDKV